MAPAVMPAQEKPAAPVPAPETAPADDATAEAPAEELPLGGIQIAGGTLLPIPIPITEPAVGYGLMLGLAFFHPEKEGPAGSALSVRGDPAPPTISMLGGAYTSNGTWAGAGGHFASWRQDRVRYAGLAGYSDVKLKYYLFDTPFAYTLQGFFVSQDVKFRLGKSRFFLGAKLSYIDSNTSFDFGLDLPVDPGDLDVQDVGLAAQGTYDTRDNIFTPNTGQLIALEVWRNDDALGGDFDYWSTRAKVNSFHRLHEDFILGWRLELAGVDGSPPFYAYPWISMRGIPALRYQNERAGVIEVEGRWNIHPRWAILGFGGRGSTSGDTPAFDTEDNIYAGGAGVRYFLLQRLGLWAGIDVARGPEDTEFYVQIGQAW